MSRIPTIEDYGIPSYSTVVITGPRSLDPSLTRFEAMIRNALTSERSRDGEFTLVHGDAIGVDRLAASIADDLGIETIPVPYFGWLRGAGGPARNAFMLVEYKPRRVHGFHHRSFEQLPHTGSGTQNCFALALKKNIESVFHHTRNMTAKWYYPQDTLV